MSVQTPTILHERLAPLAISRCLCPHLRRGGAVSEARWPCPRCIGCDPNSSSRSPISVGLTSRCSDTLSLSDCGRINRRAKSGGKRRQSAAAVGGSSQSEAGARAAAAGCRCECWPYDRKDHAACFSGCTPAAVTTRKSSLRSTQMREGLRSKYSRSRFGFSPVGARRYCSIRFCIVSISSWINWRRDLFDSRLYAVSSFRPASSCTPHRNTNHAKVQ